MGQELLALQITLRVVTLVDCLDQDQKEKEKTAGLLLTCITNLQEVDVLSSSETGDRKRRKLTDEDLDSGDDQDRYDRVDGDDGDDGDVGMEERAETVLDVKLGRHAVPRPSDGQVSSLMRWLYCWFVLTTDSMNSFIFFDVRTSWVSNPRLLIL